MGRGFIYERGEPYLMPGGEIGCLLIHGCASAPNEMRWLGEYLNEEGHTVLGIRLSGHGTRMEDMIRSRWQDWAASVEDGWYILKNISKRIFVIGLSMGGVLSLFHAARFPVEGVVCLSTPYIFPEPLITRLRFFIPLISKFRPYLEKGDENWFNQEALVDRVRYEKNPLRSAIEVDLLMERMRALVPNIQIPALVVHSHDDGYLVDSHAEMLYEQLGSADKELVWVDGARHVITCDGNCEKVFEAVGNFIERIGKDTNE